jgi:hypothetical protein
MKEARNGLSTETRSPNGNGRVRCFGFTVNVRASHFHFRVSNGGSTAGSGKTILSYALFCSYPFK